MGKRFGRERAPRTSKKTIAKERQRRKRDTCCEALSLCSNRASVCMTASDACGTKAEAASLRAAANCRLLHPSGCKKAKKGRRGCGEEGG